MDCLKGEFDVEPGDGGSRCDYLEEKGIETYLIIASKPEVKKTATQNGLNGSVSPSTPDRGRGGGAAGGCGGAGRVRVSRDSECRGAGDQGEPPCPGQAGVWGGRCLSFLESGTSSSGDGRVSCLPLEVCQWHSGERPGCGEGPLRGGSS